VVTEVVLFAPALHIPNRGCLTEARPLLVGAIVRQKVPLSVGEGCTGEFAGIAGCRGIYKGGSGSEYAGDRHGNVQAAEYGAVHHQL